VDGFQGTIISIGPQTDAVLDRFKLDDKLIPRLRVLTRKVRNTQWESVLRTPQWGLSYEQASSLSRAMLADLKHDSPQTIQVGIFFSTYLVANWLILNKVSMSFGLLFWISLILIAFFAASAIYVI
jgi:hypothetical protein